MEFTTRFGLHSQTTRLSKEVSSATNDRPINGTLTLSGAPFPDDFRADAAATTLLQTTIRQCNHTGDYRLGLFPLHSPLLRESWLVSFPPLIDMLKFSGYSCLI